MRVTTLRAEVMSCAGLRVFAGSTANRTALIGFEELSDHSLVGSTPPSPSHLLTLSRPVFGVNKRSD
jgi:hypothetical protein